MESAFESSSKLGRSALNLTANVRFFLKRYAIGRGVQHRNWLFPPYKAAGMQSPPAPRIIAVDMGIFEFTSNGKGQMIDTEQMIFNNPVLSLTMTFNSPV